MDPTGAPAVGGDGAIANPAGAEMHGFPVGADLLRRALRDVPDVLLMLRVDDHGQLRCITALSSRPTAPALTELVGRPIQDILPPGALGGFGDRYREAHTTRAPVRYEERFDAHEGPLVIEAVLTPILDQQGRPAHIFWSARDITQLEAMASALQWSEERFQALFEASSLGVAWVDPAGRFLEVNPALCEMLGRPAEQLLAASIQDLAHPDDRDTVERVLAAIEEEPTATSVEMRLVHERGDAVWAQATASLLGDRPGGPARVIWQIQDLTERRGLQERLTHQSLHDSVTGLPNRPLFLDRTGRALSRLDRNTAVVAIMVVDLDRFDTVNDTHGHEMGDRVLSAIGERLQESIRQADTIARLGSDEFGLLCEDLETIEDARALATRVHQSIREPLRLDGETISLAGTVGVAVAERVDDHPETLLRDATLAMHRAKHVGRGGIEVFDESMRAQAARRLKTETDLQRAIGEGEFRVFYQPQIDLESGTIVGVEVLARWQHPERGLVTPKEFIELAEETGIIVPLGQWVLEQAFRQSERWRTRAPGPDPLRVWVNISPRQLAQPSLPETISKLLADTGADPSGICLEVTEGSLLEESGTAVATLRRLKDLGLMIGLDDFGMGFSSLAYLKRLPVDTLKLDRTFVAGLGTNPDDSAIAAAVISLARAMGLTSIAEGVETPEQLAELRELGCQLAQGYFFSSPQPAEVMEELLGQNMRW